MQVIASDPKSDLDFAAADQVEIAPLDSLLARADYVSLHMFGGALAGGPGRAPNVPEEPGT